MRWIGAVLGGLCAGVGLVGAVGWGADPPKAPNLVLISLDTTRADALSCYGALADLGRAPGPVTPHIDALAADGLRLEHFYAHAPTTLSSHTSMHTGLDPHEHRVPRNGFPVPPELPTLAERLTGAGWQAIAVVGAAALERAMGLDRGFSVYDDRTTGKRGLMHQDSAEGVVDRALAHVAERDRSRPLFLFVHLYDPHGPYEAPEPFASRFVDPDYAGPAPTGVGAVAPVKQALRAGQDAAGLVSWTASQYLAEVAYADAQIGRLLDSLRADGVLDHALVVVTADHGEVMSEPLRFAYSHGSDVSDHVTHVPLVMWGSGVPLGRGGVRSRRPSSACSGWSPRSDTAICGTWCAPDRSATRTAGRLGPRTPSTWRRPGPVSSSAWTCGTTWRSRVACAPGATCCTPHRCTGRRRWSRRRRR